MFLRNHDELTLSTVGEGERDILLQAHATEPRMRLNLGIRRRLAPLLGNDRRRIELANALLLSLPGSPVVYYGGEIGMGDNVHLGDRDGLRTPMQWTNDIHGGFARTSVAHLVIPAIDDPIYGYRSINVAAQQRSAESLLAGIGRLIRVRRGHPGFGRGSIEFLDCGNRSDHSLLAFVRRHGDDTLLVVANLSRVPRAAAIAVPAAAGSSLVDILYEVKFPAIGWERYQLTLGPQACHWFQVVPASAAVSVRPGVAV